MRSSTERNPIMKFTAIDISTNDIRFAAIEGDNEIMISSTPTKYCVEVYCSADEPASVILEEYFDTMPEAMNCVAQFLIDEYAGS